MQLDRCVYVCVCVCVCEWEREGELQGWKWTIPSQRSFLQCILKRQPIT